MEQELISSLLDGAPTPELQKVIKDRIDTYNAAMNGDVRAMVWISWVHSQEREVKGMD